MQPGDRVHLSGLVARPELNRQLGTVKQVGTERATVRLDSGRTVSHGEARRVQMRARPSQGHRIGPDAGRLPQPSRP